MPFFLTLESSDMTAIGFVLLFAGWLIGSVFGATRGTTNKADYVAGAISFFGLIAMVAGLAAWLWRGLP